MPTSPTVQQLADAINELANEIAAMSQGTRDKEYAAFVTGTAAQQAPIVTKLGLTAAEVDALVDAARVTASTELPGRAGNKVRAPQPWDYDTTTATVADLTRRRDVLRTRLRVLEHLRSL